MLCSCQAESMSEQSGAPPPAAGSAEHGARPDEPLDDATRVVEVVVTGPPEWLEASIAKLVEARLIACGQRVAIDSIYRWEGKIEREPELRAQLHTTSGRAREVVERIRQEHPYDVPCILVVPTTFALPSYAQWVHEQTAPQVDSRGEE